MTSRMTLGKFGLQISMPTLGSSNSSLSVAVSSELFPVSLWLFGKLTTDDITLTLLP